jgi:hypothetical protein
MNSTCACLPASDQPVKFVQGGQVVSRHLWSDVDFPPCPRFGFSGKTLGFFRHVNRFGVPA